MFTHPSILLGGSIDVYGQILDAAYWPLSVANGFVLLSQESEDGF